jgi:hypothetical protein
MRVITAEGFPREAVVVKPCRTTDRIPLMGPPLYAARRDTTPRMGSDGTVRYRSGSAPRSPRDVPPRPAASPPGSRHTPAAGTFPRERARRPPGRTGQADPGPRARGHVHHHLVPLARRAGVELVVQCRLREERQGVGLLLVHRGDVGRRNHRRQQGQLVDPVLV